MPGLKHIYSITQNGEVNFTLVFKSQPEPEAIQSWIYQQMRVRSSLLPANLRLPIIQKPSEATLLHLSGPFWSNRKLREELMQYFRMHGFATNVSNHTATVNAELSEKYYRYSTHSALVPDRINYANHTLITTSHTFNIPGIQRREKEAYQVSIRSPDHQQIVNGKPQITIQVLATAKQVRESLKHWREYPDYNEYMHLPSEKRLWEYPMWSAAIIIIIVNLIAGGSSIIEILALSLAMTIGIITFHLPSLPREYAAIFYFSILMLSLLKPGKIGRPNLCISRIFVIGTGIIFLFHWPTEPFKVSDDLFIKTEKPVVRFTIHGTDNSEAKTTLLTTFLNRLKNIQVPYSIQAAPNSIQGTLTPQGPSHDIRNWLVRIALNTSGAIWFIDAPNNAAFSSAPGPIFPSQHWTLSSTSYSMLVEEAGRIVHDLNRYPGVWDARILSDSWDREKDEDVWVLNDPIVARHLLTGRSFDNASLHSKIFHGRKAKRGNQVFTRGNKARQKIRKRNRIYYVQIGHEFRGSNKAIDRLEHYLRKRLPSNIHLNSFRYDSHDAKAMLSEAIFSLSTLSILFMSLFLSNKRMIIEVVLISIAFSITVLSLHHAIDIPIPVRWEVYLIIIYLTGLLNEFRIISVQRCLWVLATTFTLQYFLSVDFRWFLLLILSILVYRIILQVPKWTSAGSLLLRLWNDLQFSQKS